MTKRKDIQAESEAGTIECEVDGVRVDFAGFEDGAY